MQKRVPISIKENKVYRKLIYRYYQASSLSRYNNALNLIHLATGAATLDFHFYLRCYLVFSSVNTTFGKIQIWTLALKSLHCRIFFAPPFYICMKGWIICNLSVWVAKENSGISISIKVLKIAWFQKICYFYTFLFSQLPL